MRGGDKLLRFFGETNYSGGGGNKKIRERNNGATLRNDSAHRKNGLNNIERPATNDDSDI